MRSVLFGIGTLVSLLAALSYSVYDVRLVNPYWGHDGSVHWLVIASLLGAVIASLMFLVASMLLRLNTPKALSFLLGALSTAAVFFVLSIGHSTFDGHGTGTVLVAYFAGWIVALFFAKAANNSFKANPLRGSA